MTSIRGIAVIDIGYTHSKALLFDSALKLIEEHEIASAHPDDGPYLALDIEPVLTLARRSLVSFDAKLPVDRIVCSAHGSGLALIDEQGELTLPVMDYAARPPQNVIDAYRQIAPPIGEVFAPILPGALTLGLQLFWQQEAFNKAFARTTCIMPWAQYAAFRLGGRKACEITALGAQTQLLDVQSGGFSSLAKSQGWDRLFAAMARAFDPLGKANDLNLRGEAVILAGIHDSNANYLRYLATGRRAFTLLSSGTWIIGFTPGIDLSKIDHRRDVVSNTDYLGRPVASCRFMGGKEFEMAAEGADPALADLGVTAKLVAQGSMALPSFSDSGGPIPNTGLKGAFLGPATTNDCERASLISLYCALMSWQSLVAVGGDSDVIVDGPFAKNDVYLKCLAALLEDREVFASASPQGTATGAALLGLCDNEGKLVLHPANLEPKEPFKCSMLKAYATRWLELSNAQENA